ncbi:MAG: N-acetyltransferase family protein [Actinomycetota bacterium]
MLRVRPAGAEDLHAVLELLGELYADQDLPDAETARDAWRAMLAQGERAVLVAELDGTVVGTADTIVMPNLTRGARPWVSVEHVVVDASHRRRGVGRAMFDEIVARAARAGAYKVQLMAGVEHDPAHDFYEALGFERSAQAFKRYL